MNPDQIVLRPIRPEDLPFLSRVYASTRQEEMKASGWTQRQIDDFLQFQFEAQHKFYQDQYSRASYEIIVYEGKDAGRLYVDRRHDEIRIVDIALLPAFRSAGLGGFLLRRLLDEAAGKGLPVRIHVENNNPAMKLYRRLGFEKTGETGVYHLMEWRAGA